MSTRIYTERLSKIGDKVAAVLDEQIKQLNQVENKLISAFNGMMHVHIDLATTLNKNPNITLAEWVASYKAKSPIEESLRQLAEVIGENYEQKSEIKETHGEWEKVYDKDNFSLTLPNTPNKIVAATRYITGYGGPSTGYFVLLDGTVYSYVQSGMCQDRTLTKLENCKLEYRQVPDEEAECRIVKMA